MKVYWVKNGVRLEEDNKHRIVEHNDQYTLVVVEADVSDLGSYECIAVNSVGEARCSAQIIIEEKVITQERVEQTEIQPKVVEKLQDVTVREGQSALFKCRIVGNEGE